MNWKKNLKNYWLDKNEKRDKKIKRVNLRQKVEATWHACESYIENFRDDPDNFDMAFFKDLLEIYVNACLPEIEPSRCKELADYCLEIVRKTNFKE